MRRRMMFKKSELPAGYKRCEYIQSDGNQFIKVNVDCYIYDIFLTATFLYNQNINNRFFSLDIREDFNSIYAFGFRSDGYNRIGVFMTNSNPVYNAAINTIYNCTAATDSEKVSYSQNDFYTTYNHKYSNNVNFRFFKVFDKGSSEQRVYNVSLRKTDGTKLLNLIPALDPSGIPCMYDTVTKQPFYNQGSGEFLYELSGGGY